MNFTKDHFHTRTALDADGMGFLLPLLGAATSIGGSIFGASQQKKQQEAAEKAAKKQAEAAKEVAKIQAEATEKAAKIQLATAKVAAAAAKKKQQKAAGGGMPKWVLPVAVGGGILVLGIGAVLLLRRKK